MGKNPFEREDTEAANLPPPYDALLAFLSDLDEQAEQAQAAMAAHPKAVEILATLRVQIAACAFVCREMTTPRGTE